MQGGIKRKDDLLPRYRKKSKNGLYQNMSKPLISNSAKKILAYISLLVLVYLILNFAYTDLNKIPMYELGDEGSIAAGSVAAGGRQPVDEELVVAAPARKKEENIAEKLLAIDKDVDSDAGSGSIGKSKEKSKQLAHAGSGPDSGVKGVSSPDIAPGVRNHVKADSNKVEDSEPEIEVGAKGVVHLGSGAKAKGAIQPDKISDDVDSNIHENEIDGDDDDDDDLLKEPPKERFNNEVARQRELKNLKDSPKFAKQKSSQDSDSRKLLQKGSKLNGKELERDAKGEPFEEKKNVLDLEKLKELSKEKKNVLDLEKLKELSNKENSELVV